MADLSVEFVGKKLRSPLGVASHAVLNPGVGDAEMETEHLEHYADLAVGYVHTPFICPEEEHPKDKPPAWKFQHVRSRAPLCHGRAPGGHGGGENHVPPEPRLYMIERLRENLPDDVAVIANMIGPGADPEGWADPLRRGGRCRRRHHRDERILPHSGQRSQVRPRLSTRGDE